jgi:hypothetical protein
MQRRRFLKSTIAGGLAAGIPGAALPADPEPKYLSLEWYRCRRDQDVNRVRDFLSSSMVPAYNRAGVRPVGLLQVSVGPDSPSYLVVTEYTSMAAIQDSAAKLLADEKWGADLRALDEKWDLAYDRREAWLLRGFRTFPGIDVPKAAEGRSNLFELRIYESRNTQGHLRKVAMFDNGEIDIFRRVGIMPVFFGSTVYGPNMPNLVYMIYFPSIEARNEAWGKFGQDPDWKKISTAPGNADRELVSRISNQLLTPLSASQLK